ncbi:alpha-L-fucosidase [Maribellus maritimus]|uniref:alpha-L-fucosidase n=1 Tax=Maribellus maritimus TaxID=2870838 RepID=UPI001EEB3B6B|nr:alpha-L-fucosidase [Maribellus maritimus]MCG6190649.1 alpha-L-fucosidase [Maribellus maritimus]
MKKLTILFLLGILIVNSGFSQKKIWNETPEQKKERLAWWTDARFGMFIHWGLYAQAARHEWVKNRERITTEDYQKYFEIFNPDLFNPSEWAKKAKAAGMKYAVITSKHHEGFTMFDSKYTDYKVTNTPYDKDIIKQWVEAFRAEGLRIGFYYSLIDWHHPDYTIDRVHPQRARTKEEYDALNKGRDMAVYREYLKNQVREILTNYGKIDILWLDFSFPGEFGKGRDDWGSVELIKMVRELQPGIIIDDRADLQDVEGGWDFMTPEQYKVDKWPEIDGKRIPWETCQTFSGSWGYYRDEYTWKDNKQLLGLLIESVSKGGNLLLNVGPTARGVFDERADMALEGMGEWMKYNSRSIYGCTEAPKEYEAPANSLLTYNPKTNRLYIHLLDYPLQKLRLPGYKGKVKYVQFLHDASEIHFSEPRGHNRGGDVHEAGDLDLSLPVAKPNVEIPVIELILN